MLVCNERFFACLCEGERRAGRRVGRGGVRDGEGKLISKIDFSVARPQKRSRVRRFREQVVQRGAAQVVTEAETNVTCAASWQGVVQDIFTTEASTTTEWTVGNAVNITIGDLRGSREYWVTPSGRRLGSY